MTLLAELATAVVSEPGNVLYGLTFTKIAVTFQTIANLGNVRVSLPGGEQSTAVRRVANVTRRERLGLTEQQCDILREVFDRHERPEFSSIVEDTVPSRGHTDPGESIPVRGHRNFAPRRTHCCAGWRLQKRYEVRATVYEQAHCYSAVNIVTECRAPGGRGARCYYDKQVIRDNAAGGSVRHHIYQPFTPEPKYITSKSGATIIETALLNSFAVSSCLAK